MSGNAFRMSFARWKWAKKAAFQTIGPKWTSSSYFVTIFRTAISHFRSITYCLASFVHDFTSDKHSFCFCFWFLFFLICTYVCMYVWLTFISHFFYSFNFPFRSNSNVGFFAFLCLCIFKTMVGMRWNCWLMWLNGMCALIVSRPDSNDQCISEKESAKQKNLTLIYWNG